MARAKHKDRTRDAGQFLALPHVVLDSPAFQALSGPAVRLLLDISRNLKPRGENNGALVACRTYLQTRGWTSNDTMLRARRELEAAGLIVETRKGMRPNRAAWYAVTWRALGHVAGMDITAAGFQRGAYLRASPKTQSDPSAM